MNKLKEYINNISYLNENVFRELEKCFTPLQLQKKDFFVREGEYARKIGFLQEGIVRAFFFNEKGKEYNKQFFIGPSIIGAYTSLLLKQPNTIAQQALTDCKILVADYERIEGLYNDFHEIERLGRKIAELYFLEKEKKEIEMALLDADKRYLILRKEFPSLEALIPQYYIASYLGISATQLSRIRKKILQL
ncbi:Crp/Fnr family transcriptional regulator [Tenacibaculum sp. E3R01]|uniref:Crp/Fnr family transcriptional regulator n=1 Tax=unclassified Tenacibaculum TaxID=2635139 RepID=UPI000897703E|nr:MULTISPECIES: Crp/Fnr family transcriptional regulator [unclassified Tenacibaculum]RBW63175.1 Crp/Fnr family transcriptional regulator [Tenacibaculum sp. E3R01]SEE43516.1 cAMP-binding domain of CRP or a regulatory subunit of cAMP-dependent protein kinases [Tenacibaculum sp. MAR_2010_89]